MFSSESADSSPAKVTPPQSPDVRNVVVKDLLDSHQQLRHEASGLRLQLASKQEVFERVLKMLDSLTVEVTSARAVITSQANEITDLKYQLEASQSRELHLNAALANHRDVGGGTPSTRLRQDRAAEPMESPSVEANGLRPQQTLKEGDSAQNTNGIGSQHIEVKEPSGENPQMSEPHRLRLNKVNLGVFGEQDLMSLPPPLPGTLKTPELAPSCKITMAARASERPPSARQRSQTATHSSACEDK